ncbi:4-phosphoerythronate dehydrogenase, partial [bacterium]
MHIVIDRNIPFGEAVFSTLGEVTALETADIQTSAVRKADILVIRSETKVNAALLEGSPVRFVGTATIGTDNVDTQYLTARGIGFASAPGCNANSVAEYITAALLTLSQRLGFELAG